MSGRGFSLIPFAPAPDLRLSGEVARCTDILTIWYELAGALTEVTMPPPAAIPARRHGLWEETCFEFFLGPRGMPAYWEFNLSPSGHWNVYRFSGYRQGREEERSYSSLPFEVERRPEAVRLAVAVDLARIGCRGQSWELGLSAVVRLGHGGLTYWALSHPGPQADFHRRDTFGIAL